MAAYIDEMWLTIGQSEMTDVPYSELRNWAHVPPVAGADNGGILYFQQTLPSKHRIRIVGRDMLSSVNADDSTVEVDGDLLEPLYNKVRQLIADERAMGNMESYWYTLARQYESEYNNAVETGAVGIRYPRPRFKVANMDY